MSKLWRDFGLAVRVLGRNPGTTAAVLLSLALGIGANTAIFSLLNAVLLRPLPVPHPEQLVALSTAIADNVDHAEPFSWPMFEELSRQSGIFSDVFFWNGGAVGNFEVEGARYAAGLAQATGNYYRAMQIPPLLGRYIGPADSASTSGLAKAVAVISYRTWRTWFRGDSQVIGRVIRIDGHPFTVIGVQPEAFTGLAIDDVSDVTVPFFSPGTSDERRPMIARFFIYARLKSGLMLTQARAALLTGWPHILDAAKPPDYSSEHLARYLARKIKIESAATGVSTLRKQFSLPLKILSAIVAAVLLIACLNIANLSLAKAEATRHQLGVQAALGANVWDLLRPPLIESLLLSFTGAAIGLLFAYWTGNLLLKIAWTGYFATPLRASPDLNVLGFTVCIAVITGLLFGLIPALFAAGTDPVDAFKRHSRSVSGGVTLFGKMMLIAQIALSMVLMLAALLFGQTLFSLHSTEVGYRRDHLLTLQLFPQAGAPQQNQPAYYRDLAEQVRRIPGVESASYSYYGPANEFEALDPVWASLTGSSVQAMREAIGPGFFSTAGMHVLAGRDLSWPDAGQSKVIISQSLAEQFFGHQSPLGRTIYIGPHAWAWQTTVVGVANSASLWKVERAHPMAIYTLLEPGWDQPLMDVRTSVDPLTLKSRIENVIRSMGRQYSLRTMTVDERLDSYLTAQRLTALLSEFFGGVALLIACVGLYGLMSYHVARRTAELGIRSALGANRRHLLAMVLREALLLAGAGCVLGTAASVAAGKFIQSILFGVSATDPASLSIVVLSMLTVAMSAAFLPARRAAHVDPMTALRSE